MGQDSNSSEFSLDPVKCPECGGAMRLPDGAENVLCPYCGVTIHVSYGNRGADIDADGTIRDRGSGYGLFRVKLPAQWKVSGTALRRTGSASKPFVPQAELNDKAGGVMRLTVGDAGTRFSKGMQGMMAMYGSAIAAVDRTNYAEMPDPLALADSAMAQIASQIGAADLRFAGQMSSQSLQALLQRSLSYMQRFMGAQAGSVGDPFAAEVLRTYTFMRSGTPWKAASYVRLYAVKDCSGVGDGFIGGIGDLAGKLGDALGGLFGGRRQNQGMQQSQMQTPQSMQAQAQQAMSGGAAWCMPEFTSYNAGGTVLWDVAAQALIAAPAADFDAQFQQVFCPVATALEIHDDVVSLTISEIQQHAAQIQQATNTRIAQNQAAFEAQQAAMRQRQAAFDSYNQSIQAASDAHHRQFMDSSRQQFEHSAPDYSEAIRGVNTFTRSDGTEVELSVHSDRAYENQAGDVIGGSGGFDPGADWTEIPRK